MSAGVAHRLKLLQEGEAKLSQERLAIWREVLELLPRESPLVGSAGGYGLEIFLMKRIAKGWPLEALKQFIPKVAVDRRLVAAGS